MTKSSLKKHVTTSEVKSKPQKRSCYGKGAPVYMPGTGNLYMYSAIFIKFHFFILSFAVYKGNTSHSGITLLRQSWSFSFSHSRIFEKVTDVGLNWVLFVKQHRNQGFYGPGKVLNDTKAKREKKGETRRRREKKFTILVFILATLEFLTTKITAICTIQPHLRLGCVGSFYTLTTIYRDVPCGKKIQSRMRSWQCWASST